MKDTLVWIVTIIISIAFLLWCVGYNNETAAQRAYAEAAVIRAQSQARLDATSAYLPYVAIVAVAGLGVSALAVAGLVLYQWGAAPNHPPRVIETRTIIILQPGQSRRELWRTVSEAETAQLIAPSRKEKYR
jgi:hypothetical protein